MTLITLPYRAELAAGQPEDIGMVLADLDAILAVVNGGLKNDNVDPAAAIALTKLGITGTRDGTKYLRDDATWQPPPSGTYLLVQDVPMAVDTASVDIQSISGGRHLGFTYYLRTDRASNTDDDLGVRFNNDSTAVYDAYGIRIYGTGASWNPTELFGQSSIRWANALLGATGIANSFGTGTVWIPYYNNTANHKAAHGLGGRKVASSTSNLQTILLEGTWRSANAINRITFLPVGGGNNFKAGSKISLYTM
jgi:hypothetical protein